jgi:dipeptidyl aminopeptidase/acylaminoacyl peptidase
MTSFRLTRRDLLTGVSAGVLSVMAGPALADEKSGPKPPPLEIFAASAKVADIALSPDGKRVALITEVKGKKFLGHFSIGDAGDPKVVPLGYAKLLSLIWADNDTIVFIFSKTIEKSVDYAADMREVGAAYFYNVVTGDKGPLSGALGSRLDGCNGEIVRRNIDGKNCVIMTFAFRQLHMYNPVDKVYKSIFAVSTYFDAWLISENGKNIYWSIYDDAANTWKLYYLENFGRISGRDQTLTRSIMTIKSKDNSPALIGWAEDGVSVIMALPTEEGTEYFEVNTKGERGRTLDATAQSWGKTPVFNPKTQRIAGFVRHDDWFHYDCFDPLMAKLVAAIPDRLDEGVRWIFHDFADDPRKMIVYTEGGKDSGSYFFIDFTGGGDKFLIENYPDLPPEWTTEKKAIDYLAADGLKIHAYLTLPPFKEAKNLPLIVLPHGGPESRDYIDFDWQAQVFASRGYAVLQPNFRGSSGYGGSFSIAGHGEWGRKMQTDLSDGVRELVKQGLVDAKRVAIVGASYGGYAALAGATMDQGVYACAVSIAGVSDIDSFIRYQVKRYGPYSSNLYYWKDYIGSVDRSSISPLHQASHAYCPILLLHGKDDIVVPFFQSEDLNKALLSAGKTVEFVPFEGQDHWETDENARIEMVRRTMAFLDKYNPA